MNNICTINDAEIKKTNFLPELKGPNGIVHSKRTDVSLNCNSSTEIESTTSYHEIKKSNVNQQVSSTVDENGIKHKSPTTSVPSSIQKASDAINSHVATKIKFDDISKNIFDMADTKNNKYIDAEKRINYFFKEDKLHEINWKETNESMFYQPGDPLLIAMNVVVLNLADIDTATMSYKMKLEIWAAWPLTEDEVKSYYENPDEWKPYIHPEPTPWTITIEEIEKMKFLSGRETQVFLWRGKFVACECTLVTAVYLESMDLVNFPFDCQHFHALIGTRCDCDIPFKVESGDVWFTDLKAIDGFNNFDGRSMAKMQLNPMGCTFNVRTHLLTLKDFKLENIECEIENHPKDIPFLHCTLRMGRNYEPYVYRIVLPLTLIMVNTTLVFTFAANDLNNRLTYVVTNMLTVVAFFFIVSSILPQIPYLTLIDKYMNAALVYVVLVGVVCVFNSRYHIENTEDENITLYCCLGFLAISHIALGIYCMHVRRTEYNKVYINRHQAKILQEHHWQNNFFGRVEDPSDEFLVHTYISTVDDQNEDIDGKERQTYSGTFRKYFHPDEAAGWLFDGEGRIIMKEDTKKSIEVETVTNIKKYIKQSRNIKNSIKKTFQAAKDNTHETIKLLQDGAFNSMSDFKRDLSFVKDAMSTKSSITKVHPTSKYSEFTSSPRPGEENDGNNNNNNNNNSEKENNSTVGSPKEVDRTGINSSRNSSPRQTGSVGSFITSSPPLLSEEKNEYSV